MAEKNNVHKIASVFCKHFSVIASSLKTAVYPLTNFTCHTQEALQSWISQTFCFSYASVFDVSRHLKQLKRKEACGHYNLPPDMLKDAAVVIVPPLSYVINISLAHYRNISHGLENCKDTTSSQKWSFWPVWELHTTFNFTVYIKNNWKGSTSVVCWLSPWKQVVIELIIWLQG